MSALGRLYAPDDRDKNFPIQLAGIEVPLIFPTRKFWFPGKILDQNGFPQCVAYAWKQWLNSSPIRQGLNADTASIYHEAQLIDEWPGEAYDGTSVRAGAKILQQLGYVGSYLWATNVAEVKQWILTIGPVVMGTNWYASMSEGLWNRFSTLYGFWIKPEGEIIGGHAWVASGYSLQRRAFRMVNSWGYNWGERGKAWIAEEHLQQLLNEQGECCTAVEQKLVP